MYILGVLPPFKNFTVQDLPLGELSVGKPFRFGKLLFMVLGRDEFSRSYFTQ